MKRIIIFSVLILAGMRVTYAQLLYPEVMEIKVLPLRPLPLPVNYIPTDLSALKRVLNNSHIDNPAVRNTIQNLKHSPYADRKVNEALNTLIQYAENDSLKKMVRYLRDYIHSTGRREDALRTIERQITYDSVELYSRNQRLLARDFQSYMNTDLEVLASYIRQDSNYQWLKEISRDSVLLEILNAADNSIRFWINNGREDYYRFWAVNKAGDSIGTWIQVVPPGNNIRVYVDDDVYQNKNVSVTETKKHLLSYEMDSNYYELGKVHPGMLRRRHWTYYSEVEVALGQGYLANWASGGENSLSLLTNVRYFLNYNKNKTSWENFLHYRLGFLQSGNEDLRKNEERLELNSKLGLQAYKHWFYTGQLNIQTMIFNSFEYSDNEKKLVGNFMSPAYFTVSVGLDYKPNNDFSLYLSPIAGKWTYVRDTSSIDPTRYGVDAGKKSKGDAGARVELRNKFQLWKIVNVRNELIMFSSYYNSAQRFTADWKVQIDFKINYFMRASIYTNVVYDQNYSKKLQFKENLNLGVNFRF